MSAETIVVMLLTGGALGLYGRAVLGRQKVWRRLRDQRSRDALVAALALFMTALFAMAAIVCGQLIHRDDPLRPMVTFLVWGALAAFLASGWFVYDAWDREP